jgi:precorrin-6B methylase 2
LNSFVDLTGEDPNDRAEIRYVPTPDFIVAEMIRMAGITSRDVVYEPGCGDARITIAAVKAGARRGVGIDLDAARVAESQKLVTAAGLQNRIEIRQGDALDIKDLSEATVVFLYMGEEFDVLLRPLLWKQLRVGARVVSHRFRMGDWTPDETITVARPTDDEVSLVHVWTITQEVKAWAAKL